MHQRARHRRETRVHPKQESPVENARGGNAHCKHAPQCRLGVRLGEIFHVDAALCADRDYVLAGATSQIALAAMGVNNDDDDEMR